MQITRVLLPCRIGHSEAIHVDGLSATHSVADPFVHCSTNPLFAAEITLGSLHGNVPEKELYLLQLTACRMAQLRARAPQIMRSESSKAEFLSVMFHYMPHQPLRHVITPPLSSSAYTSKQFSGVESGFTSPSVYFRFDPSQASAQFG
jgi:hypothetical protein